MNLNSNALQGSVGRVSHCPVEGFPSHVVGQDQLHTIAGFIVGLVQAQFSARFFASLTLTGFVPTLLGAARILICDCTGFTCTTADQGGELGQGSSGELDVLAIP